MRIMVSLLALMMALGAGYTDAGTVPEVAELMEDMPIAADTLVMADEPEEAPASEAQQIENAVVDVDAWGKNFEAIWNDAHEDKIEFAHHEPDDEEAFPTLLMADMESALHIQLYYSRSAEVYWFVVSISEDYTPVRKQAQYEEYFFSAITTGLLAHYEDMTIGDLKHIDAAAREYVSDLQAGTVDQDDAYFYYYDTYISFEVDEEMGLFECVVGF